MKQSSSKHKKNASLHWRNLLPPKTNPKNLHTLTQSHPYTPPTEHQTTPQTAPCPTAPPKTNPKNLRTLTPILEVRTLIAKAIWGINTENQLSRCCLATQSICTKDHFDATHLVHAKSWGCTRDWDASAGCGLPLLAVIYDSVASDRKSQVSA